MDYRCYPHRCPALLSTEGMGGVDVHCLYSVLFLGEEPRGILGSSLLSSLAAQSPTLPTTRKGKSRLLSARSRLVDVIDGQDRCVAAGRLESAGARGSAHHFRLHPLDCYATIAKAPALIPKPEAVTKAVGPPK